jgi:hypothetical protein
MINNNNFIELYFGVAFLIGSESVPSNKKPIFLEQTENEAAAVKHFYFLDMALKKKINDYFLFKCFSPYWP